jgi:hypothetical protein
VPGFGGFQLVGTLTQLVPVMKGGKLVPVTMSYTFSSDDAAVGKVTFQITAQIISGRDAIPADNTAISSPPTRVISMKPRLGVLVAATLLLSAPAPGLGIPRSATGSGSASAAAMGPRRSRLTARTAPGDERQGSFSGFLKLGGTLNQHVLLGVESNGWTKEEEGTRVTIRRPHRNRHRLPTGRRRLFLKAGAGASYLRSEFREGSFSASFDKTGWAVLVGAGYDFRVGRNVSLTPCINYHYGKPGDIDVDGEVLPGFKQNVVSFELGITFH